MPEYHVLTAFSPASVGDYEQLTYVDNSAPNGTLCRLQVGHWGSTPTGATRLRAEGGRVVLDSAPESSRLADASCLAQLYANYDALGGVTYPLLTRIRVMIRLSLRGGPLSTDPLFTIAPATTVAATGVQVSVSDAAAGRICIRYRPPTSSSTAVYYLDGLTIGDWWELRLEQTVAGLAAGRWSLYFCDILIAEVSFYTTGGMPKYVLCSCTATGASGATDVFELSDFDIWQTLPEDYRPPYAAITPSAGGRLICEAAAAGDRSIVSWQWADGTEGASCAIDGDGYYACTVTDSAGDAMTAGYQVSAARDVFTASWNTGDTAQSITVTASGVYTYTAANAAGSGSASVAVTFPATALPEFEGDPAPKGHWIFDGDALAYRVGAATVQSQYAASPRILSLAELYWETLNPSDGVNLMLRCMINPQSAEGAGLDVWGRIVGIKRSIVPADGSYLAYDPGAATNPAGDTWDNAPFNPVTGSGLASDAVFRTYVYVKAMLNIGNGSLASLNYYFSRLYPDSGVQVVHPGTMMIRILDYGERLTEADIYVLKSLDWVPAGVGWQLWQGDPNCFGFSGSELHPFDQAPFMPDDALTVYG